jgi:hypothetical protein
MLTDFALRPLGPDEPEGTPAEIGAAQQGAQPRNPPKQADEPEPPLR